MSATNTVAHELEGHGVRTFSAKEMAFNILGLMHPLLFSITQVEPIWADLNGGMDRLPDLADITTCIRTSLMKKSDLVVLSLATMLPTSRSLMEPMLNVSSKPSIFFLVPTSTSTSLNLSPRKLSLMSAVLVLAGRWEMEA